MPNYDEKQKYTLIQLRSSGPEIHYNSPSKVPAGGTLSVKHACYGTYFRNM